MKHARADYDRIQDPEGKIAEDEPVFLIRAKDKTGPLAVRNWARTLRMVGGDERLAELADRHAEVMEAWQEKNGCKLPDL